MGRAFTPMVRAYLDPALTALVVFPMLRGSPRNHYG